MCCMVAQIVTPRRASASAGIFQPQTFTHRTRLRFARKRIAALVNHLGREPSYPECILLNRIVALEWELQKQDAKMDAGEELSGHAMRARHAAENRLRLDLVALGLRAAPPPRRSLMDRLRDASAPDAAPVFQGPPGPVTRQPPP